MEVTSLEPALEPIFWEHVKHDIPHYYFFAFDWKYNQDETEILLALREERIDGMMLVYNERIVQLRGSSEAAETLLERLDLEEIEFQAPEPHEQYILKKYEPTWSHRMMLMTLGKGEERIQVKHSTVGLEGSDAEEIAAIMRAADPEYWGTTTSQTIRDRLANMSWLGIKTEGELASIGGTRLTKWAGLIGVVATIEAYRNRGYATSIVSELVKQILKRRSIAMIYVLSDNLPAVRAYEKVGFTPYRTYFFMRGQRR